MTAHCWKSNTEFAGEKYGYSSSEYLEALNEAGVCMLELGHSGDHQWTPDGDVLIYFARRAEVQMSKPLWGKDGDSVVLAWRCAHFGARP